MYSRVDYYHEYPYCSNRNIAEITLLRFMMIPHVTIVAVYRSPSVSIREASGAIEETFNSLPTQFNIFMGAFNVNWLSDSRRTPLYNFFIRDNGYRQLVFCSNTDSNTCIDHIYTNLPEAQAHFQTLQTYFSDYKAIWALRNCFEANNIIA